MRNNYVQGLTKSKRKMQNKRDCHQTQAQQMTSRIIKVLDRKEYGASKAEVHTVGETESISSFRSHQKNTTEPSQCWASSKKLQMAPRTCSKQVLTFPDKTILEALSVLPVLLTHKPQPVLIAVASSCTTVFIPISESKSSHQLSLNARETSFMTQSYTIYH